MRRARSFPVTAAAAALAAGLASGLATGCAGPVAQEHTWEAFGDTAVAEVFTRTAADGERALAEIRGSVTRMEQLVDTGGTGAELAVLNRLAADSFYRVQDRDLYRCLLLALDYARASRGAFDPTVGPLVRLYRDAAGAAPTASEVSGALGAVGWDDVLVAEEARAVRFRNAGMSLDLGGVAKGFALDVASRVFTRTGMLAGRLQIGGNFYVWGSPLGAREWTTVIRDPRRPTTEWLSVRAADRGIAVTAAGGERRIVIDPATGLPPAGDVQVALAVADSGGDADALSTALLVAGSVRGGDLLERARRVEAVLLVDGPEGPELRLSGSLEGRVVLSPELEAEVAGRARYILPPARLP